jgi:hypothetical protein
MASRCSSQALADELRPGGGVGVAATMDTANSALESGVTPLVGFAEKGSALTSAAAWAEPGSGVTSLVGFAGGALPQAPGGRRLMPAVRRYSAAVVRWIPVAFWIFRRDHPSRPKAMTCCFFSSLKTLLMLTEGIGPRVKINVPGDVYHWSVLK